jgi:hypothetical protein
VGFVVEKVALGRVFSEYFGFPCQSSFHQILHHHNQPGQVVSGRRADWTQFDSTPTKRKISVHQILEYDICIPNIFSE